MPCLFRRCTSPHTEARLAGSRPSVGSSRNSMRGSWISALARSSRRFIPPEYVLTCRSAASSRPTMSKSSSERRFDSGPSAHSAAPARPAAHVPSKAGRGLLPARPRRSSGVSRACSCRGRNPSRVASPDVGASSVVSMRTVVVLPAPFGPRKPKTSPSLTSRLIPATASTSAEYSFRSALVSIASNRVVLLVWDDAQPQSVPSIRSRADVHIRPVDVTGTLLTTLCQEDESIRNIS